MQSNFAAKLFNSGIAHNVLQALKSPITVVDSLTPYISIGGVRHKRGKISNKFMQADPESINYHGFSYFPRFPGQVDPPYEPSKLLMVKKVKSGRKKPHWEKYIMGRHFGLTTVGSIAIVKNSPETNKLLYRIKHLIEIKPITFPHGVPTDANNGFLDSHGRYMNYKLIDGNPEEAEKSYQDKLKKSIQGETLRKRLLLRWQGRWDVI